MGAWGQIADAIGSVSSPFVSKLSLRGKRGGAGQLRGRIASVKTASRSSSEAADISGSGGRTE